MNVYPVKITKVVLQNREKTLESVLAILQMLNREEEFSKLPYEKRFQLSMQFYQCERGRLQKGKMVIDTVSHLGPWVVALLALWKVA